MMRPGRQLSFFVVGLAGLVTACARQQSVRLNLSSIPSPYREASARVPVSVAP